MKRSREQANQDRADGAADGEDAGQDALHMGAYAHALHPLRGLPSHVPRLSSTVAAASADSGSDALPMDSSRSALSIHSVPLSSAAPAPRAYSTSWQGSSPPATREDALAGMTDAILYWKRVDGKVKMTCPLCSQPLTAAGLLYHLNKSVCDKPLSPEAASAEEAAAAVVPMHGGRDSDEDMRPTPMAGRMRRGKGGAATPMVPATRYDGPKPATVMDAIDVMQVAVEHYSNLPGLHPLVCPMCDAAIPAVQLKTHLESACVLPATRVEEEEEDAALAHVPLQPAAAASDSDAATKKRGASDGAAPPTVYVGPPLASADEALVVMRPAILYYQRTAARALLQCPLCNKSISAAGLKYHLTQRVCVAKAASLAAATATAAAVSEAAEAAEAAQGSPPARRNKMPRLAATAAAAVAAFADAAADAEMNAPAGEPGEDEPIFDASTPGVDLLAIARKRHKLAEEALRREGGATDAGLNSANPAHAAYLELLPTIRRMNKQRKNASGAEVAEKVACPLCSKTFTTGPGIAYHLKNAVCVPAESTGGKVTVPYQCPLCDRSFQSDAGLAYHVTRRACLKGSDAAPDAAPEDAPSGDDDVSRGRKRGGGGRGGGRLNGRAPPNAPPTTAAPQHNSAVAASGAFRAAHMAMYPVPLAVGREVGDAPVVERLMPPPPAVVSTMTTDPPVVDGVLAWPRLLAALQACGNTPLGEPDVDARVYAASAAAFRDASTRVFADSKAPLPSCELRCGGPIGSMDLLSCEDALDDGTLAWLATAANTDTFEHIIGVRVGGAGHVLIWRVDARVTHASNVSDAATALSVSMAHAYGACLALRWCPSLTSGSLAHHVGVIAGAFTDGSVRVFAVPDLRSPRTAAPVGTPIVPFATFECTDAVPTCVCWSDVSTGLLVVGSSDGRVVALDVSAAMSAYFSTPADAFHTHELSPIVDLWAHETRSSLLNQACVRSVAMPPGDARLVAAAYQSGRVFLWDLTRPQFPLEVDIVLSDAVLNLAITRNCEQVIAAVENGETCIFHMMTMTQDSRAPAADRVIRMELLVAGPPMLSTTDMSTRTAVSGRSPVVPACEVALVEMASRDSGGFHYIAVATTPAANAIALPLLFDARLPTRPMLTEAGEMLREEMLEPLAEYALAECGTAAPALLREVTKAVTSWPLTVINQRCAGLPLTPPLLGSLRDMTTVPHDDAVRYLAASQLAVTRVRGVAITSSLILTACGCGDGTVYMRFVNPRAEFSSLSKTKGLAEAIKSGMRWVSQPAGRSNKAAPMKKKVSKAAMSDGEEVDDDKPSARARSMGNASRGGRPPSRGGATPRGAAARGARRGRGAASRGGRQTSSKKRAMSDEDDDDTAAHSSSSDEMELISTTEGSSIHDEVGETEETEEEDAPRRRRQPSRFRPGTAAARPKASRVSKVTSAPQSMEGMELDEMLLLD